MFIVKISRVNHNPWRLLSVER